MNVGSGEGGKLGRCMPGGKPLMIVGDGGGGVKDGAGKLSGE